MTKENNLQRFHRIYSVCLGIVIIISGICFIAACLGIYNSGEHPFSRESVATAFKDIAIPVYACAVMTVIGIIFDIVSKAELSKQKPDKPYAAMLKKAYSTRTLAGCDETVRSQISKEQNSRKIHSIIRTIVFCGASIIFLVYATNSKNFHQSEITDSMISAMWVLLPCLIVCFAYGLFTVIYSERSLARELELVKTLPTATAKADTASNSEADNSTTRKLVLIARIAILIIGACLLVHGFMTGGTMDVLTKAINICTECIGLG